MASPPFAPGYGFIPVPGGPVPDDVAPVPGPPPAGARRLTPDELGRLEDPVQGTAAAAPGAFKLTPEQMARLQDAPTASASFFRGAGQGASLGFSDEIVGAVESLFSGKDYEQARDESRAANAVAQQANPAAYVGGEVTGGVASSLVPGVGLAKGAGIAAKAGLASTEGAVTGLGYSEGKDLKTLVRDAATGALVGGALGGTIAVVGKAAGSGIKSAARKLAEGAPDRAKKRIVTSIVESTNPKPRNNLIGKAGEKADEVGEFVLKDDELFATYRNPEAFLETVQTKIDSLDPLLDQVYGQVDKISKGVDLKPVKSVFDRVIKDAESAYSPRIADAIRTKRNQVMRQLMGDVDFTPAEFLSARSAITLPANAPKLTRKAIDYQVDELAAQVQDWVKARGKITIGDMDTLSSELLKSSGKRLPPSLRGPVAQAFDDMIAEIASKQKVPASELRTITRRLQKDGFDNVDIMNVTEMKAAAQDVGMGMRELLNQHIESIGGKASIADAGDIRALNKKMSMLLDLRAASEPSAKRARGATQVSPFSLKNLKMIASNPVNQALIALADPAGLGAAGVAANLAVKGAGMADDALARRGAGAVKALGELPGVAEAGGAIRSVGAREAGSLPARAAGTAETAAVAEERPKTPRRERAASVADLAGMARKGASIDEILAEADRSGVSPAKAQQIARLFGPR